MRVDLPKNVWLTGAELDFFREGLHSGTLGLTLSFSGADAGNLELVSEVLEPLTKLQLPKRKIVRFRGLFAPQDPATLALVKSFKSWGFQVHAVIGPDQIALPWLNAVDWLILETGKPFVPVATNELWYKPPQTEDLPPEPRVPTPDRTLLYFAKGHSSAMTVKFITTAKLNWSLL